MSTHYHVKRKAPTCYITWWLSVSDCSLFNYQFDRKCHV